MRIVENILAVYHYESGEYRLNKTPENIVNIIETSIRMMLPLAKDKNSRILQDIDKNLPSVMLDKNEIGRVVTNLLNNAIKHTKPGTEIKIKSSLQDNNIIISITDNGEGIKEEDKPNIFQRYPTVKRKIGTGLGLYLSKQIIDAHKGKIWFSSEAGRGTTFSFTLPIE